MTVKVALPAVLVSEKFVTPKWVLIVALPALLWSWNSISPLLVMVALSALLVLKKFVVPELVIVALPACSLRRNSPSNY